MIRMLKETKVVWIITWSFCLSGTILSIIYKDTAGIILFTSVPTLSMIATYFVLYHNANKDGAK